MNDVTGQTVIPQPENGWHSCPVEEIYRLLDADPEGLTATEAEQRLHRYGTNTLPSTPRRSALARLLDQFRNVLIYVLLASALITLLLGHLIDAAVIMAVVIANAIIGYLQEGKAEKAMDAIRDLLAPVATVRRDGRRTSLQAARLVPGDIVYLEAGNRIPADLRLISSAGLGIQESMLTGESVPVEKSPEPVAAGTLLGDRLCMAYSGTLVTGGQGMGIVVGIGQDTEVGRIGGMLATVETLATPLVDQMASFSKWLTGLILILSAGLLWYGYVTGRHAFDELFMAVVGLAVAAIPEGLPAVMSITLAIGVQAMARRNAIVRRLPAIEALGSVSVICTDKTGTLTRNEMTVKDILASNNEYQIEGSGYIPAGDIHCTEGQTDRATLTPLLESCVLCNDAALHGEGDVWQIEGDPMEAALLVLARKAGIIPEQLRARWHRRDVIPFDAEYRFMATLDHSHTGEVRIVVKGAPETLLAMCALQYRADGTTEPLNGPRWQSWIDATARRGRRILALAERRPAAAQDWLTFDDVSTELVLIGMVGLIDPPRDGVREAVALCRSAGIRVKMITGDHPATAAAIASDIGLEHPERVVTGVELESLAAPDWPRLAREADVFARTSPGHKLALVEALQSGGEVVAMTGDGINDAPALKRADVGIAMGRNGSEAAREAAELVLADDNFTTIVAAVREGRTVYDNIAKVIGWTLPTNGGETATIALALLFGMALPVTPVQILWINLITVTTLGIAMAFEPPEPGTMQRRPRSRTTPLLPGMVVWQVALVSLLFLFIVFGMFRYAIGHGHSLEYARTMALNTIVLLEIFYLFYIKNRHLSGFSRDYLSGSRTFWLTVGIIVIAQLVITHVPVIQTLFNTRGLAASDWLRIVAAGCLLWVIIESEKRLSRWLYARR